MSSLRWKRELSCGLLDVMQICLIVSLVLLNTGFLPVPGSQSESYAVLGVCGGRGACPATCTAPVIGTVCTVAGAGASGGTCATWCGGCFNAPQCGGTYGILPCWCSWGC
jgi:hypothetical protein